MRILNLSTLSLIASLSAAVPGEARGRLQPLPGGGLSCDELPSHLRKLPTSVDFKYRGASGLTDVSIQLPKLAQLPCSLLPYEYGSDYVFRGGNASIDYADRSVKVTDAIVAQAPMLAAERDVTPHSLVLVDEEGGVQYYLNVDVRGRFSSVEVRTFEGRYQASQLIQEVRLK